MKFARIIPGYDHLWAVRDESQKADELTRLFQRWNNANYLLDFFLANLEDLQGFFHIEKISDAIKDTMEDADELERLILEFPSAKMQDRKHTQIELDKLNICREYLIQNGVFDQDSFVDYIKEE